MDKRELQAWLLRVMGAVEVLAFFAVVMPRSWMEASHAWLGMGAMPEGAVLMFMIRQASYVYGMHGVSLFVIARDVERFRPLVVFNGVTFLLAAPVFFLIDYTTGMPWFWTAADTLGCGFFGPRCSGSAGATTDKANASPPETRASGRRRAPARANAAARRRGFRPAIRA